MLDQMVYFYENRWLKPLGIKPSYNQIDPSSFSALAIIVTAYGNSQFGYVHIPS